MASNSSGAINIPLDLMVEILEKLPTKSLARFRCVSYQWGSIINNYIVIDSIVTRRSNKPPRDPHFFFERLLKQPQRGIFRRSTSPHEPFSILSYTYLYHQVTDEEQLYHEEIIGTGEDYVTGFQHVRGLIGFSCSRNVQFRIYNPTTRQSLFLPVTRLPGTLVYLFGYDPFKNQYKVLCLTKNRQKLSSCKLFVLGDVSNEWWDIQCSIGSHFPLEEESVCINGTIYYKARDEKWTDVLVSFDVRHEIFNHVQTPENLFSHNRGDSTLVNYHGKLGWAGNKYSLNTKDMDIWVMQDAEKQEWSKVTFLDMLHGLPYFNIRFAGVTNPGGEIVLVRDDYLSEFSLDVYYYDPKQNGLRRAEIQTTTSFYRVRPSNKVTIWAVTDHVENIMRL